MRSCSSAIFYLLRVSYYPLPAQREEVKLGMEVERNLRKIAPSFLRKLNHHRILRSALWNAIDGASQTYLILAETLHRFHLIACCKLTRFASAKGVEVHERHSIDSPSS